MLQIHYLVVATEKVKLLISSFKIRIDKLHSNERALKKMILFYHMYIV